MADLDANPALEAEIEADLYVTGDLRTEQSAGDISFFIQAEDRISGRVPSCSPTGRDSHNQRTRCSAES